jgi:hypothetical protein
MKISKRLRLCIAVAFLAAPAGAIAAPLNIVKVAAPDVNCVFDPSCKLTVADTAGDIPVPNITDKAVLQSRTFSGASGAPGEGLTGYEYRVDLTQATAAPRVTACVTDMTIDLGPLVKLQYDKVGATDDVYVVTKGGLGSIGLLSADMTGTKITFVFAQPVCAASDGTKGATSYFFGLTAKGTPKDVMASAGIPGLGQVDVKARAPQH